jgi:hypothetical protein
MMFAYAKMGKHPTWMRTDIKRKQKEKRTLCRTAKGSMILSWSQYHIWLDSDSDVINDSRRGGM